MTAPSGDGRPDVAVCICTHRRPAVLSGLLDRLEIVAADARPMARVSVVVVDDDPARSAESVVAGRDAFEGGIHYSVTGSGNISTARNRALADGCRVAGLLALIDDDCDPHDDWLRQLLLAHERFGTDIVSGYCIDLAPPGAPPWYRREPWVRPQPPLPDGTVVVAGGVKNTLVTSAAIERYGLRFDEDFGKLGGEDALFFYSAARHGASHRYAAAAVVSEEVPLARTSLSYQLRRALWYGNSEAVTQISSGLRSRPRVMAAGGKRLVSGPTHVVRQLADRGPSEWRWGLALMLMGCGRVAGALGVRLRHSSVNAAANRSR